MIIQKTLTLQPSGLIQSGSATYTFDSESGLLQYVANLVAMFMGTLAKTGSIKIDPTLLLSSNIKLNESLVIGPVTIKVTSVVPGVTASAFVTVKTSDIEESGTATLDLSGQYAVLENVNATGTYDNIPVSLGAS